MRRFPILFAGLAFILLPLTGRATAAVWQASGAAFARVQSPVQPVEEELYISVSDENGQPVLGLTAGSFALSAYICQNEHVQDGCVNYAITGVSLSPCIRGIAAAGLDPSQGVYCLTGRTSLSAVILELDGPTNVKSAAPFTEVRIGCQPGTGGAILHGSFRPCVPMGRVVLPVSVLELPQ